jgi:hypothetical protein
MPSRVSSFGLAPVISFPLKKLGSPILPFHSFIIAEEEKGEGLEDHRLKSIS